MSRAQRITLVVIVIILAIAAGGLNYYEQVVAPTTAEIEQKQLAPAIAKMTPSKPTAPPVKPIAATPGPDTVAPADLILGNPTGKTVVGLGYTVDAATERDPGELDLIADTIIQWSKLHPNDEVKIVCLDLPKDQLANPNDQNLPLGLSVNGTNIGGCDTNPGEGLLDNDLTSTVLNSIK